MAAALIVGLGVAAVIAEEPDGDAKSAAAKSGWWAGWFGEKPKPKPVAEKKAPADDAPAPPNSAEMGLVEQKRQMNAVLRRMEVCDRLRMVALQSGNEDLMRQADELEARAREVYRQQTAHLPAAALPHEADTKPKAQKPIAKETAKVSGSTDKPFDVETMAVKPADSRGDLSVDFKQRERTLINGTFMGRDKP